MQARTAEHRRRRIQLVRVPALAAALVAGGLLSGCDDEPPDAQYGGVCVDETTHVRVDDSRCGDYDDEGRIDQGGHHMTWIHVGSTATVPAHGQHVPDNLGSRTVPKGTPIAKGVPAQGGQMATLQRGGFGAKAGTVAGVGAKAGG